MIDDELLSKFDRIEDLPVSEEMLGAYLEGNLDDAESLEISSIVDSNPNISAISFEINNEVSFEHNNLEDTSHANIEDFSLPEINAAIFEPANLDSINAIDFSNVLAPFDFGVSAIADTPIETVESFTDENNFSPFDSSDADAQSLDTDYDVDADNNMFNDNYDY